jgi:hypothetical protein
MKTILAIWNSSEKGKSSTVLELANLIITIPGCSIIFSSKPVTSLSIDFRIVINIKGKIIALESQGDPGTHLENRLDDVITKYNPDLIFCTCRTRGETVAAINKVANSYGYDKIWTSTYETTHSHKLANSLKAVHLHDLVSKLGLI